jgi:hypothetical protein
MEDGYLYEPITRFFPLLLAMRFRFSAVVSTSRDLDSGGLVATPILAVTDGTLAPPYFLPDMGVAFYKINGDANKERAPFSHGSVSSGL